MRVTAMLLLGFTLAACGGPSVELPLWKDYVPPSMPTMDATGKGIKSAVAEYKLTGAVEMSDIRHTDFVLAALWCAYVGSMRNIGASAITPCSSMATSTRDRECRPSWKIAKSRTIARSFR